MKKFIKHSVIGVIAFLFIGEITSAQEGTLVSRKGEPYLPDSADWAIGIDAAPVINYFGNFFRGTAANVSPSWGYPGTPLAITGKYFKNKKTAYRAMLRLGFGTSNKSNYVINDTPTSGIPDPTVTVTDELKTTYHNITLGGGMEMRRGKTRLQGYYGWMAMAGKSGKKETYSYGNNISQTNPSPSSTNWTNDSTASMTSRITKQKYGSTFMLGLRGFVGAEYFLFPKISIGAEFGWGLGFSSTGDGIKTTAEWDGVGNQLKLSDKRTGRSSSFGLDTDVNGMQMMPTGALMLTMHF